MNISRAGWGMTLSLGSFLFVGTPALAKPKVFSGDSIQSKVITHFATSETSLAQVFQDGLLWSASNFDYDYATGGTQLHPRISVFDPAHPEEGPLAVSTQIFWGMVHLKLQALGNHRVLAMGQTVDRIGFYAVLEYLPGKKSIQVQSRAVGWGLALQSYVSDAASGNHYFLDGLHDQTVSLGNGPLTHAGISFKQARDEAEAMQRELEAPRTESEDTPAPAYQAFMQRTEKLYLPGYFGNIPPEEGWTPVYGLVLQDGGLYSVERGFLGNGDVYRIDLTTQEKTHFFNFDRLNLSDLIPLSGHRLAILEARGETLHVLDTQSRSVGKSIPLKLGKQPARSLYEMEKYGSHCLAILRRSDRKLFFVDTTAAGYPLVAEWDLSGTFHAKGNPARLDVDSRTGAVFIRSTRFYAGEDGKLPKGSPNELKLVSEKSGETFAQCK